MVRRARRPDLPGMKGRARWLVLLAALLAFTWQSIVAEAHFHSPSESASRTLLVKQGAHGAPLRGAPLDSPASCPLCRELAHAHHYLPPAPLVFDTPGPAVSPILSASANISALPRRWHGWRSRAPPLLLQA